MAKFRITSPDGTNYEITAPDDATEEQLISYAQSQHKPEQAAPAKPKQPLSSPNWLEDKIAKLPNIVSPETESKVRSFVAGMADPSVGAFQLGANIIGQGDKVNKAIANKETEINNERNSVGRGGMDGYRLLGNVASPANLIMASRFAPVATTGARALQGLQVGAIGGLTAPVTSGDNYAGTKALQTVGGAAVGGVMAPVAGKIGDVVGNALNKIKLSNTANVSQADVDKAITNALSEVKQNINDIDPSILQNIRQQVTDSLRGGKNLDVASAFRKADFDALGMQGTEGQITRDPIKFAREMNLRGVNGVGEPIQMRFDQQAQILQNKVGALKDGAQEAYPAGKQLATTLANTDETLRKNVTNLYTQARNSAGKDLDVPLQGLAQDYTNVLDNFADKVPAGVRNQFKQLGLEGGQQLKPFTIEGADRILKVISDNRGTDRATNLALDKLSQSIKNAVLSVDSSGGPYAPAVKAAAERFRLQDAIPALKAASNGDIAPDDFVQKFIVNGKTEEVNKLASLLKTTDKTAYDQARAQIGASLYKAAFGNNAAGDKAIAAERFGSELNKFGSDKLAAFFTKDEIAQLKTIERVAAYRGSTPSNAPVNYSGTSAALVNLLKKIPGVPAVVSLADAAKTTINNGSAVKSALAANVPTTAATVNPKISNALSKLLVGGTLGFTSGAVRQ